MSLDRLHGPWWNQLFSFVLLHSAFLAAFEIQIPFNQHRVAYLAISISLIPIQATILILVIQVCMPIRLILTLFARNRPANSIYFRDSGRGCTRTGERNTTPTPTRNDNSTTGNGERSPWGDYDNIPVFASIGYDVNPEWFTIAWPTSSSRESANCFARSRFVVCSFPMVCMAGPNR